MYPVESINYWLSLGTILLELVTIALAGVFLARRRVRACADIAHSVETWALPLTFVTSLTASALSLFYSEILGFPPCPLCWWQRIFLYPQVILFGFALFTRDRMVALYSMTLSSFGAAVALYHHLLQVLPSGSLPCPAEGTVSCAQRFIFEFGYVTFPMMAFSLFAFLIVLMLFALTATRRVSPPLDR